MSIGPFLESVDARKRKRGQKKLNAGGFVTNKLRKRPVDFREIAEKFDRRAHPIAVYFHSRTPAVERWMSEIGMERNTTPPPPKGKGVKPPVQYQSFHEPEFYNMYLQATKAFRK